MKDQNPSREPVGEAKTPLSEPLPLRAKTQWGEIAAKGFIGGERYYWMIKKRGVVSMMPATVVEALEASKTPGGGASPEPEPSLKIKGRIPWPTDKKESFHGIRKPRKNWRPPGQAK